ncbi:MAG: glycosyltransferase family 2 protein [Akkermansiaceae bacterium]|nr:glycosyltransferase family 2 protein [Akkermansiaceae bacterium]
MITTSDFSFTNSFKQFLIIPCFNRKSVTLGCLKHLWDLGLFSRFGVILVDDGSTDGTAEAVAQEFPTVEILHGTGDLYWTGAIELGMRTAFSRGVSCVVWLNDDTVVAAGAVEAVVARAEGIGGVVSGQGQIVNQAGKETTYFPLYYRGAYDLKKVPVNFEQEEVSVDSCRGNLVAVSHRVVETIGYPDGAGIPHVAGDSDYGLRASKAGLPVRVLTGALVSELCVVPPIEQSWLLSSTPITALWKSVFQKRNGFYLPMVFVYHTRHWGIAGLAFVMFRYAKLFAFSCLRIFPHSLRIKFFTKLSKSVN